MTLSERKKITSQDFCSVKASLEIYCLVILSSLMEHDMNECSSKTGHLEQTVWLLLKVN